MSFVAGRGVNILGAVTTVYKVVHPKTEDANSFNSTTRLPRHKVVEIVNATGGLIFVKFDGTPVAPAGNGVQGEQTGTAVTASEGGPYAATPGTFDICISGASWPAVDLTIPPGSVYVGILTVAAGSITVTYGGDLGG